MPFRGLSVAKTKKVELVLGEVRKPVLETAQASVTKLMKVISIEQKPGQRIVHLELKVKAGVYRLSIDEATALAIAALFD
jgi:hypothetical protein